MQILINEHENATTEENCSKKTEEYEWTIKNDIITKSINATRKSAKTIFIFL